jgi:trehalose/maltose hydrolase-like predicted phosphorylase
MVPASLPFIPDRATNNVRFRKRILAAAMRNAREEGHPGARYSLISEVVEGEENCIAHSSMARGEIHFTADAAISAWMCYCATGDLTFLRVEAWPVIRAVAEYFASRVTWIEWENRYELLHVHSAEEALGAVHNDLFTNAAVRKTMRAACRSAELIGIAPNPVWREIESKLHQPINPATGQYQAHSGTEGPCSNRFLEVNATAICDLDVNHHQLDDIVSVPPIPWDMSLQATVAAQAGNPARMREYLDFAATNFIHEREFLLRTEFKDNDAGPYLCGSGAFLLNLVQGAGGLRWTEEGLTPRFAPCLPAGITRITLPRLEWHRQARAVTIDEAGLSMEPLEE